MSTRPDIPSPASRPAMLAVAPAADTPYLRAPEGARTVFLVTLLALCGPLAGGIVLFGWRAAAVAVLSVASCIVAEGLYFRVTRAPSMLGRAHAAMTGIMLALTLPAYVPWYVPVVGGAFAVIVGKAVFGGVGHFVWHPALVGRLAVAVLFSGAVTVASEKLPSRRPVLAADRLLVGDIRNARAGKDTAGWKRRPAPAGADAILLTPPTDILRGLTDPREPEYSALVFVPSRPSIDAPAALLTMPPIANLLYGARPGGIGETCAVLLLVAGLYLVYRNYLKWQMPLAFLVAAYATAAVAPIYLAGAGEEVRTVWFPLLIDEGLGAALTYIHYQVLSGGLLLAILLAGAEMTARPVTTGGQVVFGLGGGVLAMLAQLYLPASVPIPCLVAVLAMNTFTPTIDRLWRPRVLGMRRFAFLRR